VKTIGSDKHRREEKNGSFWNYEEVMSRPNGDSKGLFEMQDEARRIIVHNLLYESLCTLADTSESSAEKDVCAFLIKEIANRANFREWWSPAEGQQGSRDIGNICKIPA